MRLKTLRNTHHNGRHQDAFIRTHPSSKRAQTLTAMTTEYQERFASPHCHKAIVTMSTRKVPDHLMKASGADSTTLRRTCFVSHKLINNPPQPPPPPMKSKGQQRTCSSPNNPLGFGRNQVAKLEDYTSVYQSDFRAWKVDKRQPFKMTDNIKVNQGLSVQSPASKGGRLHKKSTAVNSKPDPPVQKPEPFQSVTSYQSDYVAHKVQPKIRRENPANHSSKDLLSEPVVSQKPKVALEANQNLSDNASDIFNQFKSWCSEKEFQGKVTPPADHDKFTSTAHADYPAHKCQSTKPILPSIQTIKKESVEPFQAITTMREDYKAWNTPRRFPAVNKEKLDGPKKITISVCTHAPAESWTTNTKPFSPHPKLSETADCSSTCNVIEKLPSPTENGVFSSFECISNGAEESIKYWTTSLNRGVTLANVVVCEEPSDAH